MGISQLAKIADTLQTGARLLLSMQVLAPDIQHLASHAGDTLESGGAIFFMGNGGSAADCQHIVGEFVGRYLRNRRVLPAVSLVDGMAALTSIANDYSYDHIFSRKVDGFVGPKDMVVGISTSGDSVNVCNGILKAASIGAYTVGITGENGGRLSGVAAKWIEIPSAVTPRIQEGYMVMWHIVCELIDCRFSNEGE